MTHAPKNVSASSRSERRDVRGRVLVARGGRSRHTKAIAVALVDRLSHDGLTAELADLDAGAVPPAGNYEAVVIGPQRDVRARPTGPSPFPEAARWPRPIFDGGGDRRIRSGAELRRGDRPGSLHKTTAMRAEQRSQGSYAGPVASVQAQHLRTPAQRPRGFRARLVQDAVAWW